MATPQSTVNSEKTIFMKRQGSEFIIYGTRQATRRWHIHILDWMDKNGYPAVNSEQTIFMKRVGEHCDFIIHCLFVDDMMHNQYQAQGRVSEEVLQGFQHHWRLPHENVPGNGGRTGQEDDQAPS